MTAISLHTDDFVPRMLSSSVMSELELYCVQSRTPEQILSWLSEKGYAVTWDQFRQFVSDALHKGVLTTIVIEGDNWPTPIARPAAVSGLGVANGNVWFGTPSPAVGKFRFYVNGVLKQILTDYYITELSALGAVPGDTIQICQEVNGVVGWWASIQVPS